MRDKIISGEVFPLIAGDNFLKAMLVAGKFFHHNDDVNEQHFPMPDKLQIFGRIYSYEKEVSDERALADMMKNGDKPAGLTELLLFKVSYPEVAKLFPLVVAMDSLWHNNELGYPCLSQIKDDKFNLDLDWINFIWNEASAEKEDNYKVSFLAISPAPPRWLVENGIIYINSLVKMNQVVDKYLLLRYLESNTNIGGPVQEILEVDSELSPLGNLQVVILTLAKLKSLGYCDEYQTDFFDARVVADGLGLIMPSTNILGELIRVITKDDMREMKLSRIFITHNFMDSPGLKSKLLCLESFSDKRFTASGITTLDYFPGPDIGFIFLKPVE